ncbi:MAG: hypothetical protein JSR61_03080 [Proteobacteria bacterium]|nr:hypothetical protein [Pseudomonadota bacterium]
MTSFHIPANPTAADIERVVAAARASRAEALRAAAAELNTTIKRFFAGFHRPAAHKGAAA